MVLSHGRCGIGPNRLRDWAHQQGLGQSEVKNFGLPARRNENVRGLDIAMNDALAVSGVERIGNLDAEVEYGFIFQRFAENAVRQRLSLEILHGNKWLALVLPKVVNGTNIRMIEGGSGPRFAFKALESLRILCQAFRKKFERYTAAQAGVLGFVHDSHPSAAQFAKDAVMRDVFGNDGQISRSTASASNG